MGAATATMAKGPLRPSPRLLLRPQLLLILTCCTADTVWDTDTGDTEATTVDLVTTDTAATAATAATATMAKGPLRQSPRLLLRPRLLPTCCTADTDTDTGSDTEATTAV